MEMTLSITDFFKFFKKHVITFCAMILTFAILFTGVTALLYKRTYESKSSVLISTPLNKTDAEFTLQTNRINSAIAILASRNLLETTATDAGVSEQDILKYKIKPSQTADSQFIEIGVSGPEESKVMLIADKAVSILAEKMETLFPTPPTTVTIWSNARKQDSSSFIVPLVKSFALGTMSGIILLLLLMIVLMIFNRKILNFDFIAEKFEIPVLGVIRKKTKGDKMLDFRVLRSALFSLFRINEGENSTILTIASLDNTVDVIDISKSIANAISLSQKRLLIVDTIDSNTQEIAKTEYDGVDITGVSVSENISDVLASSEFKSHIHDLSKKYDYVFIATPKLGIASNVTDTISFSHGVVALVEYNKTNLDDFQNLYQKLISANSKMLGIVGIR